MIINKTVTVRAALLASVVSFCSPAIAAPDAQPAQVAAEDASSDTISDIVVTARRKNEDAQDVPVTMTAVSGAELQKQDIRNVTDLVRSVPGVSFCCQRGEVQFPFVRGVPGVKGYFAEVPAVLDGNAFYFDLQSVQILKGPQGTLFGTATNGGAILNEPHRPDKDFGGYVATTLGTDARKGIEAVINAPLSDTLQLRAGVQWNKSHGYVRDGSNGRRYGGDDYYVARLGLNFEPSDGFKNYLVANYYDSKGPRPPFTPVVANPAFASEYALLQPIILQQALRGRYDLVGTNIAGGNSDRRKLLNIVNQTTIDLNDSLKLRNILGFTSKKAFSQFDSDGTTLRILDSSVTPSVAPSADHQFSEELQLQGKFGTKIDFTIGTFHQWFKAGTSGLVNYNDLTDVYGILTGSLLQSSKSSTHAIFGEATYNFGDEDHGLRLTGGLRYTIDNVDLVQTNSTWIHTGPTSLLDLATINAVPHREYDLHDKFKKMTFKAGLQYVFDNRRMAYFTASRGYSAGGFNTENPAGRETFQPESLTNYELGLKADWGTGDFRVRTNLAVYYGKYDNVQVSTTQANCTDPNNAATCTFGVGKFNAAKADVIGGEMELLISPIRALEFGGTASYNDNKYTRYVNDPDGPGPLPAQDLSGQPFVYNPKYKLSLFGTVRVPLNDQGELSFTTNFSYQTKLISTATPKPQFYDKQPGYSNLDARIDWNDVMGKQGLSASLFVTNLTKNQKSDGGLGAYNSLGLRGVTVAVPRQFGVRLRYDF